MAEDHMSHVTVRLNDGKVLTVGGRGRGSTVRPPRLARAEVYDPSTGEWTAAATMNEPRASHTATTMTDGRIIFVGGQAQDGDRRALSNLPEIYSP